MKVIFILLALLTGCHEVKKAPKGYMEQTREYYEVQARLGWPDQEEIEDGDTDDMTVSVDIKF